MYQYNWFPKKGMLMHSLIIIQFPCFTLKIGAVSKITPPHHNDERGKSSG